MLVGGFAELELRGGRGLGLGEAVLGIGGLDRVVVLRERADRVDDAPADEAVVVEAMVRSAVCSIWATTSRAVQSGCLALISAATPAT